MSATRKLIVTELAELTNGVGRSGRPWVLYRATATTPEGAPIRESLTTFAKLPTGQEIEVEVEVRDDPRYGRSFTLKLRSGKGLTARVEALEQRVAALEAARGGS